MTDERDTQDDGEWAGFEKHLADVHETEPREAFESDLRRRFVTGFAEDDEADGRPGRSSRVQLWAVAGLAAAVLVAVGWWFGQRDVQAPDPRDDVVQEGVERPGPDDTAPEQDELQTPNAGDQLAHETDSPDDTGGAPDAVEPAPTPASRGWRLAASEGELPGPERRPLERGLRDGTVLDVDERAIDIELDAGWSLRALPGARFVAEALPLERADGPARLRLLAGEVLIRTPRDYAGPPIQIGTPHTDVTVVGTALSVMTEGSGTCVCVSHGTVAVAPKDERPQESVMDRQTCYVFADGTLRYLGGFFRADGGIMGPKEGMHLAPLLAFDAE